MSKFNIQNINVLNYNENEVFVNSSSGNYKFSASKNGETPTIVPMPLDELQYIASNTDIILTGWLTFDEDIREEVYKELRIPNWEDILSNEDITEILTHPTIDGLKKIIAIENQTYFDRVRIIMFKLSRDGADITARVNNIVNQRYNELRNRQRISSLSLSKKDTKEYATPNDVKALSEQNESLQNRLMEMETMLAKLVSSQREPETNVPVIQDTINDTCDSEELNPVVVKKKPGRPAKKTS